MYSSNGSWISTKKKFWSYTYDYKFKLNKLLSMCVCVYTYYILSFSIIKFVFSILNCSL